MGSQHYKLDFEGIFSMMQFLAPRGFSSMYDLQRWQGVTFLV